MVTNPKHKNLAMALTRKATPKVYNTHCAADPSRHRLCLPHVLEWDLHLHCLLEALHQMRWSLGFVGVLFHDSLHKRQLTSQQQDPVLDVAANGRI